MKKIFFGILAAAALTACDPSTDNISWSGETISAEQLANGVVIKQYDGTKDACGSTEIADGNWIEFSTNPSKVVRVYFIKKDGTESDLSVGKANGLFYFKPARGSEPQQTLFFETLEFDGSSVTASKQITVQVATSLSKEMAMACSNNGSKVWKWDSRTGSAFWGNFGYTPGPGANMAAAQDGQWWGVTSTAEFADQQQHRGSDTVKGDDDTDAYMVFEEDGSIKSFDATGKEIRSGSFEIKDYDEQRHVVNDQPWHLGKLKTTPGSILWPYAINKNGYQPEEFEILVLSADQLVLSYADAGTGGWSEATFWRFYSDTDAAGAISGYTAEGENWTWDTEIGTFWGNAGYNAGGDWSAANQGQWWGITSTAGFADQQAHRGGDKITGDDDTDAWMTFFNDGSMKSFDATGKEIRSGSWEIDMTPTSANNLGVFKTTAGSILWPYAINTNGFQPTEFEVTYVSGKKLALVYAAPGTGDWSECTFWRFMKK